MRTDTMIRGLLLLSGLTFLGVVAAAVAVQHWSFDDAPVTVHGAPPGAPPPAPRTDAATVTVTGTHGPMAPGSPIPAAGQGMEDHPGAPGGRGGAGTVHLTEEVRPGRPTASRAPGDAVESGEGGRPGAYDRETGTSGNSPYRTHSGAIAGRAPAPQDTLATRAAPLPPSAPAPATGTPDATAPQPVPAVTPEATPPGLTSDQPPASGTSDAQAPSLDDPADPSRGEDTATASPADETEEELPLDDAEPWPNNNCPERLPAGSTRATADIMTRTYGCQYLQYCQAVNDGSGDTRCWWGAWRLPGG